MTGLELMQSAFDNLLLAYESMMDTEELFSPAHEALVDRIEDQLDNLLYLLGRDARNAQT